MAATKKKKKIAKKTKAPKKPLKLKAKSKIKIAKPIVVKVNKKPIKKLPAVAPVIAKVKTNLKVGKKVKGKNIVAVELTTPTTTHGKKKCREPSCKGEIVIQNYCRLHYIKNWKRIKRKEMILATGQLNRYVEELVAKYPDKYLDVIRQDLSSEKDYAKVVSELELESSEDEFLTEDEVENIAGGTTRRAPDIEDDEPDTF